MKDWLKNIVLKILVIPILLILLFVPIITHNMPQEANFDATVYDDANILSPNTEAYITQLNNKYANYKRQPNLMIVTVSALPAPIDMYKYQVFNEMDLGDSGILVVLAINNKTYGVEIDADYKKNSFLLADLGEDFITDHMISLLQAELYDDFVIEVSDYIDDVLTADANGYYEQVLEKRNNLIIAVVGIAVAGGLVFVIVLLVRKYKEKKLKQDMRQDTAKSLNKMFDMYSPYLELFDDRTIIEDILQERYKDKHVADFKDKILTELYEILCQQYSVEFDKIGNPENKSLYIKKCKQINTFSKFKDLKLMSAHYIIQQVDESLKQKASYKETNQTNITKYFNEIASTLPADVVYETLNMVRQNTPLEEHLLTKEEIIDNFYLAVEAILMEQYSQQAFAQKQGSEYGKHSAFYKKDEMYKKLLTHEDRPACNIPWSEKKQWIDSLFWDYIAEKSKEAKQKHYEHLEAVERYEDAKRKLAESERIRREESLIYTPQQADDEDDNDTTTFKFPLGTGFSGRW